MNPNPFQNMAGAGGQAPQVVLPPSQPLTQRDIHQIVLNNLRQQVHQQPWQQAVAHELRANKVLHL